MLVGGEPSATVTSGNFSPVLERGIALALLDADRALEPARGAIDVRGRALAARCVQLPFVGKRR